MKKIILSTVCAAVILCGAAFSGCNPSGNHSHSWSDEWTVSETEHWHKCSGCSDKKDNAEHVYDDDSDTSCNVCGYVRTIHQHDWSNEWSKSATKHWHACSGCSDKKDEASHVYDDSEDLTCNVCGYERTAGAETLSDEYILEHSASDYGYKWLATQTNGDKLQAIYQKIADEANKIWQGNYAVDKENKVNATLTFDWLNSSDLNAAMALAMDAFQIYKYDHPYNFWDSNLVTAGGGGGSGGAYLTIAFEINDGYETPAKLNAAKAVINANINEIYAQTQNATSDYEKAWACHDAIALRCDYTYDADNQPAKEFWAHCVTGILDDDAATGPVCEGYAKTFELMLNLCGVENVYCTGYATGAGTGGGGAHAWNMAKLEGNWYYFDVTWDDGNDSTATNVGSVGYEWMAVSSTKTYQGYTFSQTHQADTPNSSSILYNLPTVTSTEYAATFAPDAEYSNANFTFVRKGLSTVGVKQVLSTASTVVIPEKVEINGRNYTVTALGPYIPDQAAQFFGQTQNSAFVIPKSVTYLGFATFYRTVSVTIYYEGTQAEWNNIVQQQASGGGAFCGNTPTLYCSEQWKWENDLPVLV